jgi:hypothetical protein
MPIRILARQSLFRPWRYRVRPGTRGSGSPWRVLRQRVASLNLLLGSLLLPFGLIPQTKAVPSGTFTELAAVRGVGYPLNTLVGPGPTQGSERYYISYSYTGNTADVVALDPNTGEYQVFTSPDKTISVAWGLAVGPDGKIYVGTTGKAKLLRIDPKAGTIVDLGRASETESYIWQLVVGADNRLYGCTYPNAKLVRYDPNTGKMEDLGRMDPKEQYARFIAASEDGFIYTGIGFSRSHLVAYEIRSGQHRDILPAQYGMERVNVMRGDDGKAYAEVYRPGGGVLQHFRLEGWNAAPIPADQQRPIASPNRLKDGRIISSISDGTIDVLDPKTKQVTKHAYRYAGKEIDVFRLALGPDGLLYGSTAMPLYLFRLNPATGQLTNIGRPGGGEVYSFLPYSDRLLMAGYSSLSPLMVYKPKQPYGPGAPGDSNPLLVTYPGADAGWRPMAMIAGPAGDVYVGSIPGYGLLGGSLTVFDPATSRVKSSDEVIPSQSIVSLTRWKDLIVGGTTVRGGGGSFPTEREAKIFLWDPVKRRRIFDMVPVPSADSITDLVTAANGQVFGLAGTSPSADQLFVFDPAKRKVIHRARVPFVVNAGVYNSLAPGPNGRLYGLFPWGIFSIDVSTYASRIEANYRGGVVTTGGRVSAGFGLSGRDIYFASGPWVVRYTIQ